MSTVVAIQCPHCKKTLKVENPKLLGKRVKCPGCKNPVVLSPPGQAKKKPAKQPVQSTPTQPPQAQKPQVQEPVQAPKIEVPKVAPPKITPDVPVIKQEEEVKLELVTDEPPVGTSARWVPDEPTLPPQVPQFPTAEAPPATPQFPNLDKPPAATPTFPNVAETPAAPQFPNVNEPPAASVVPNVQAPAPTPAPVVSAPTPAVPVLHVADSEPGSSPVLNRLHKRKKKKNFVLYAMMGLFFVAAAGTVGYLVSTYQKIEEKEVAEANDPTSNTPVEEVDRPDKPYSKGRLEGSTQLISEFKPTSGEPIKLLMVPSGVNFLIHLRPAELWSDEYEYQVLRASLTDDVTNWIAAKLKEVCRRDPQQIEEAMIGFILGARGTEPYICAVVHLKEEARMSDLLDEFKGTSLYDITERPDLNLRVDDKYGYLIQDAKTIAICPAMMAGELEAWIHQPNYEVTEGMARMLDMTDRQRLITIVGEVNDLRTHSETLVPEPARPTVNKILEFIGEDVETASWSVHTLPYLHSELVTRPINTSNALKVQTRLKDQFEDLPEIVWKDLCLKMQPSELRFRKFIGRLPAMLEALQEATVSVTGPRYVQMTTVLPAKATPNLALATLFTANEAARTDFSVETKVMVADNKPKLPDTVVERLRIPVDSEFARTPLEPSLQYLCDEIQVNLFVNGDALKDAGYTKNMPQTFKLGMVPMEQSLAHIVNTYQEVGKIMVVSINEETKTITVTTKKFAEKEGLPIYQLKSE